MIWICPGFLKNKRRFNFNAQIYDWFTVERDQVLAHGYQLM